MYIKSFLVNALAISASTAMLAGIPSVATASFPMCQSAGSDPDGDGFGWENNATCSVGKDGDPDDGAPFCLSGDETDPDDDGWGWENGESCIVDDADDDVEDDGDDIEEEFSEARLYFELNDTDGDLGFHGLIDGEDWVHLEIDNPMGHELLDIRLDNQLYTQKLTELFFESNEPDFNELDPDTFFARFPEGQYLAEAELTDGSELSSEAMVTHLMPAPPANITVNGLPVSVGCEDNIPVVFEPVTISWDPVTHSHSVLGRTGVTVDIARYELVVEVDGESNAKYVQQMAASQTSTTVPTLPHQTGNEFKMEVIAREDSDNQTAVEACFRVN